MISRKLRVTVLDWYFWMHLCLLLFLQFHLGLVSNFGFVYSKNIKSCCFAIFGEGRCLFFFGGGGFPFLFLNSFLAGLLLELFLQLFLVYIKQYINFYQEQFQENDTLKKAFSTLL